MNYLLTVQNRLRPSFAHFKLCAHFFDLRRQFRDGSGTSSRQ
jgi:hypothetical protein